MAKPRGTGINKKKLTDIGRNVIYRPDSPVKTKEWFKKRAAERLALLDRYEDLVRNIRDVAVAADFRMELLKGGDVGVTSKKKYLAELLELLIEAKALAYELTQTEDCTKVEGLMAWEYAAMKDLTSAQLMPEDGKFSIAAKIKRGSECLQIPLGTVTRPSTGLSYELRLIPRWCGKQGPHYKFLGMLRFYPEGSARKYSPWDDESEEWPEPEDVLRAYNATLVTMDMARIEVAWFQANYMAGRRVYSKSVYKIVPFWTRLVEEASIKTKDKGERSNK